MSTTAFRSVFYSGEKPQKKVLAHGPAGFPLFSCGNCRGSGWLANWCTQLRGWLSKKKTSAGSENDPFGVMYRGWVAKAT